MRKSSKKIGLVSETSDYDEGTAPATLRAVKRLAPRLISVSHYHNRPGIAFTPVVMSHGMQCFELMTEGHGWVESGGKWVELFPGDLLWHMPGDCTIGRSDFANPYHCLAVRFCGGDIWKRTVPHVTRWDEIDEVRRFTRQVVGLHADDRFDSLVLLRYIVSTLQFQAELYARGQSQREMPIELQRALNFLEQHYGEPLHLKELAREAEWSVPHLHDRFKEVLGLSPHQALIRRRIQAARELLAGTNEPIKSVASRCGFTTAAAFCAQFKKITQISPKGYRKRQHYGSGAKLTG